MLVAVIVTALVLFGAWVYRFRSSVPQTSNSVNSIEESDSSTTTETSRIDLSFYHEIFQFSADFPEPLYAEYDSSIESIAFSSPPSSPTKFNTAQIFIRHFEANDFQTLSTVNILSRESTKVGTHEAVRYEIEKKAEVANFANQPIWRNQKHEVIDIRYAPSGRTSFFVIARNPAFEKTEFDAFIASLQFHNDRNSLRSPLDRASERVSKKTFGTKVSPNDSPVSPERFSGYHTGWDFEIFPDELNHDVTVTAFCGGKVRLKESASGYGGLLVQECNIDSAPMTVVYGHLKLSSIAVKVGAYRAPGDEIGLLGDANSAETDGERKHLHFGLRKGTTVNNKGYVGTQAELSAWLDPKDYLE